MATAFELLERNDRVSITIVGPSERPGCGTLAAAAMLNSFCEVESGTLANEVERRRFDFNRLAVPLWPEFLDRLSERSQMDVPHGTGTFVINNTVSDDLEDDNFLAIQHALELYGERHDAVDPRDIPAYAPETRTRATRAIYIPDEGWVNPLKFVSAMDEVFASEGAVEVVDTMCMRVQFDDRGDVCGLELADGRTVTADHYVLAPGANLGTLMRASHCPWEVVPMFYGVGATITLQTSGWTTNACIRTPNRGLACGTYSAPRSDDAVVVGASNFIAPTPESEARAGSVYSLVKSAIEQINSDLYRSRFVSVNVGWRSTSADTLPVVGDCGTTNATVVSGMKRDGFHCSPLLARAVADRILDGVDITSVVPSEYTPVRSPNLFLTREEAIQRLVRHRMNSYFQHDFVPPKMRFVDDLRSSLGHDFAEVHDRAGLGSMGIPPELIDMYRYGNIAGPQQGQAESQSA
jgi:glycine oxidase